MTIQLTWSLTLGVTFHTVQYKLATSTSWINHSTLPANVNSVNIAGLQNNVIYDFRVLAGCSTGTASPSEITKQINITCPLISFVFSNNTIEYSFLEIGGSITGYEMKLFNAAGTTEIATSTPTGTFTKTGSFTGLNNETSYKLRLVITAGTFTKNCSFLDVSGATPCNFPTNVTASLEASAEECNPPTDVLASIGIEDSPPFK